MNRLVMRTVVVSVCLFSTRLVSAQVCEDPLCLWDFASDEGTWVPGSQIPSDQLSSDPFLPSTEPPKPYYDGGTNNPCGARRAETLISNINVTKFNNVTPAQATPAGGTQTGAQYATPLAPAPLPGRSYQQEYAAAVSPKTQPPSPATGPYVPQSQATAAPPSHAIDRRAARALGSDPVDTATGEFVVSATDIAFPGFGVPFELVRSYRSGLDYLGPLGYGWDHSLNQRIVTVNPTSVVFLDGRGHSIPMTYSTVGSVTIATADDHAILFKLYKNADGTARMWDPQGFVRTFDANGLLTSQMDLHSGGLYVSWEQGPSGTQYGGAVDLWRVKSVTDSVGRQISFLYEADGLLHQVTGSGLTVTYDYTNGDLTTATDARGKVESYDYHTGSIGNGAQTVPEDVARLGCQTACAGPSAACAAEYAALSDCQTQCLNCDNSCHQQCTNECAAQDVNDPKTCAGACQTACQTNCTMADAQGACDEIWSHGVSGSCGDCAGDTGCDSTCSAAAKCFAATLGTPAYYSCAAGFIGLPDDGTVKRLLTDGSFWKNATENYFSEWKNYFNGLGGIGADTGECIGGVAKKGFCAVVDFFGADCSTDVGEDCDYSRTRDDFHRFCQDSCYKCNADGEDCGGIMNGFTTTVQKSCNDGLSCADDCKNTFFGTGQHCGTTSCAQRVLGECKGQCQQNCLGTCQPLCRSSCFEGCDSACGSSCVAKCEATIVPSQCEQGCVDGCIAAYHTQTGNVVTFGSPEQLNHNLLHVKNGAGVIVVDNSYGEDPSSPDFDKVTTQINAGATLQYHHVPLDAHQATLVADQNPLTAFVTSYQPYNPCIYQNPLRPAPVPAKAVIVSDAFGTVWSYYFDARYNVVRIVNNGTGSESRFTYNVDGFPEGEVSPGGVTTCRTYLSSTDKVRSIMRIPAENSLQIDPYPVITNMTYQDALPFEQAQRLQEVDSIDPPLALVHNEWTAKGDLLSSTTNGATTKYFPDGRGKAFQVTAPNGGMTTIKYDEANGTVSDVVVGFGGSAPEETTLSSDAAGRPVMLTSPGNEVTKWTWDGNQLKTIERQAPSDVPNETKTFVWNADADVKQWDDGDQQVTYGYDSLGLRQTTTTTDLSLGTTRQACTLNRADGQIAETVSPEGRRVRIVYDGEGRPLRALAGKWAGSPDSWDDACPSGTGTFETNAQALWSVRRNADGLVWHMYDDRGIATDIQYDGFNRPVVFSYPEGTIRHVYYDRLDRVAWIADFACGFDGACASFPRYGVFFGITADLGALTTFTYDGNGRLQTKVSAHFKNGVAIGDGQQTTTWTYSPETGTTSVQDDNGTSSSMQLDEAGRESVSSVAGLGSIQTKYLPGRSAESRIWNAPSQTGFVGERRRYTSWGAPAGQDLLQVDATGHVVGTFATETYTYDRHRQLVRVDKADGSSVETPRDAFGQVTDVNSSYGSAQELVHLDRYLDGFVKTRKSVSGMSTPDAVTSYHYDDLGRLDTLTRPGGIPEVTTYLGASEQVYTQVDGQGVTHTYDRWANGEVRQETAQSDTKFGTRRFLYDGLGRLKQATNVDHGTSTWDYDSLGCPTSETVGAFTTNRQCDALGRAQHTDYLVGGVPNVTADRTFDALGRLTGLTVNRQAVTTPGSGFSDNLQITTTYSGFGGPTTRVRQGLTGAHSRPISETDFHYDELGRMIELGTPTTLGTLELLANGLHWYRPLDGVPRMLATTGLFPEVISAYATDGGGRLLGERHGQLGAPPPFSFAFGPADANAAVATPFGANYFQFARSYSLDGRGNWVSGSTATTRSASDQYLSVNGVDSTYDHQAPTSMSGQLYDYDVFGDLVHAVSGGQEHWLQTDGIGRIVQDQNAPSSVRTMFGYDGASLAFDSALGITIVSAARRPSGGDRTGRADWLGGKRGDMASASNRMEGEREARG